MSITVARFAQELRAVGIGDDGFEMQLAVPHFRESADGNLAASAQAVEQGALAGGSSAGGNIVQELKMLACGGIAFADFDAERPLSRRRGT